MSQETNNQQADVTTAEPVIPAVATPAAPPAAAATQQPAQKPQSPKSLPDPASRAAEIMGVVPNNVPPTGNPPPASTEPPAQSANTSAEPPKPADGKQPPVSTTPPVDFNPISYFKEKHGIEIKDEDDLKNRLSAYDTLTVVNSEKTQLETKLAEIAEQLAAAKIEDPYVLKLHELRKGNATPEQIRAFNEAFELKDQLPTLDPNQKIKLHLRLEKGFDDRMADAYIRKHFTLVEPVESDYESKQEFESAHDDYILSLGDNADRVKAADKFLTSYVETASNPLAQQTEGQKNQAIAQQKYLADIETVAPKIADQFSKITANLSASPEAAEAIHFDFPVSDDFKKEAPELLKVFYKNTGTPLTEDGFKAGLNYLQAMAKSYQYDKDVQKAYNHGSSTKEAALKAEYDRNGGFVRPNGLPPDPKSNEFETWRKGQLQKQS